MDSSVLLLFTRCIPPAPEGHSVISVSFFFFVLMALTWGHNNTVSMEADLFRGLTQEMKSAGGFSSLIGSSENSSVVK